MALDTDEWLVWLGVKGPSTSTSEVEGDVELLRQNVGDYDALEAFVDARSSFSDYESELQNQGFTADEASAHRSRVENNFASWSDYSDFVVQQTDTYIQYKSGFGTMTGISGDQETPGGESAAGVRIHRSAGVSYSGVDVPAGTVEVYGNRVEFSQQGQQQPTQDQVTYSNLSVSDTGPTMGETITVTADVSNPNNEWASVTVPYLEDGTVEDQETAVLLAPNGGTSVTFDVTKNTSTCVQASIGDTSSTQICWFPDISF